ncbi:PAS domain-containing protein [Periweissella cryptocerci]|uniref:histidine kinase n=1 Tax=Periweissella cryptocerci TaxID=2506420 RepID=A0A4P6YTA1_9LACO|nr:ATP-binding protein [Periweissella cryptocerci]QBO35906.1 PAS domain-containing protein [Periweissella cryptocerci]
MQKAIIRRIGLTSLGFITVNVLLVLIVDVFEAPLVRDNFVPGSLVIAVVLTLIEIIFYARMVIRHQNTMAMMSAKLDDITKTQNPGHILLEQEDPYYSLATAINKVQSFERDQIYRLQRQEGELSTLLEYLPVGVLLVNRHRKIKMANPAASELLGLDLQINHLLYADASSHYGLSALVEKTMQTEMNQRATLEFETGIGQKTLEVSTIYHATTSTHFQIIILLYDITEVAQLEQMQADFVSNASHELKTPITAISGFSETLLAGAKDDPATLEQFLKIIDEESKRLIDLIEDVLSISRLNGDYGGKAAIEEIELASWVQHELATIQVVANQRNIELRDEVGADMRVKTQSKALAQILKNLVGNAIKYGHEGGFVSVSAEILPVGWRLVVHDNGIGIPTEQQPRVFERFYRGDPSRTRQIASGTGLGLAIVKELVEKMNGQLFLKSQVGVGTTITMDFK